jgi:chromosome segregation ATPase
VEVKLTSTPSENAHRDAEDSREKPPGDISLGANRPTLALKPVSKVEIDTVVIASAQATNAILPADEVQLAKLRGEENRLAKLMPRLKFFSDMPDRGLFAGVVLVGFLLIIGAKVGLWWLGLGDYSGTVLILTMVLMLGYGFLARRVTDVRLRSDRLGDNFYYMGFIFTLASMSAALIEIRGGEEITTLIGSFGIALLSTVLGIAGRVVFAQMRTEVEDIEVQARQSLLEATQTLKGQLTVAVNELDVFRSTVRTALDNARDEAVTGLSMAARSQVEILEVAVRDAIGNAEKCFEAHVHKLDQLDEAGSRINQAVDDLTKRLGEIDLPKELLSAKLDILFERLAEATRAFELSASADELRQKELIEVSTQLRRVVTQIANQVKKLQDGAEDLGDALKPSERLAASLNKAATALDGTVASSQQLHETLQANARATEEIAATVRGQRDLLLSSAEAQRDALKDMALDTQQVRKQIVADLEASRAAVSEVQKALAETALVVTKAIAPEQSPQL